MSSPTLSVVMWVHPETSSASSAEQLLKLVIVASEEQFFVYNTAKLEQPVTSNDVRFVPFASNTIRVEEIPDMSNVDNGQFVTYKFVSGHPVKLSVANFEQSLTFNDAIIVSLTSKDVIPEQPPAFRDARLEHPVTSNDVKLGHQLISSEPNDEHPPI
jgi:hypothetical protein